MTTDETRKAIEEYADKIHNGNPLDILNQAIEAKTSPSVLHFIAGIAYAQSVRGQLGMLKSLRDMYFDHMEGTDAIEFEKWERLYVAAAAIVEAIESEIGPLPPKPEERV